MSAQEKILTGEIIIAEDQCPILYKDSGLQKYLDKIKEEVRLEAENLDLDPTTEKGRAAIGSLARKVSSSKVCIEKPGRDYLKKLKAAVKPAEAEIKRFCDAVDAERDRILEPRKQWLEAEEARQAKHQDNISYIRNFMDVVDWGDAERDSEFYRKVIELLEKHEPGDSYEEFLEEAEAAWAGQMEKVKKLLSDRIQWEADQAELQRLREAEERRQEEENRRSRFELLLRGIEECGMGFIGGKQYGYAVLHRELTEKYRPDDSWGEYRDRGVAAISAALAKIEEAEQRRIEDAEHLHNLQIIESYLSAEPGLSESDYDRKINALQEVWRGNEFGEHEDRAAEAYKAAVNHIAGLRLQAIAEQNKKREQEAAEQAELARQRAEQERLAAEEAEVEKRRMAEAEARERELAEAKAKLAEMEAKAATPVPERVEMPADPAPELDSAPVSSEQEEPVTATDREKMERFIRDLAALSFAAPEIDNPSAQAALTKVTNAMDQGAEHLKKIVKSELSF